MRTDDGDRARTTRRGPAMLAVGLLAAAALVGVGGSASAATCDPETSSRGDLDGDGGTDLVVGMPTLNESVGGVDVRYTGRASQVITPDLIHAQAGEGSRFGSALAVGDLDGDGCADLVIGAGNETPPDEATQGTGVVHILFGSPTGLQLDDSITVTHPKVNTQYPDEFGSTLAVAARRSGTTTTHETHDLYVGAPGLEVGGLRDAGGVYHYSITAGGADRVTVTANELRSQDSAGVPGVAEKGDRFGEELAGSEYGGGVVASAPREDIGKATNAGAIWYLPTNDDGTPGTAVTFSQDSAGVPGKAETGDHFGSALSIRGSLLVVGVPDENDGSKKDSGIAQLFTQNFTTRKWTPGRAISQDSAGIPGAVEAGDRFGAAVQATYALRCQEFTDMAIGAPGEDVGTRKDAGTITVVPLDQKSGCQAVGLRQGSGLNGATEAGDQVGGVLGVTYGRTDLEEDYADRLLVGVPHEDVGAQADAGLVQSNGASITVNGIRETTLTYSAGLAGAQDYGTVLSRAFD